MAVKYHCSGCSKRYVEWGAKKLNFKCPDCGDEDLVRTGSPADVSVSNRPKPSLKRSAPKAKGEAKKSNSENEVPVVGDGIVGLEEATEDAGIPLATDSETGDLLADGTEVTSELDYGSVAPPLGEHAPAPDGLEIS